LATFNGRRDRLAAKGYVERVPDPNDRRVQRLEPTPAALTLMPKMLAASKRMNEHVLGVLEEDERAAFQRTLMKLVAQAELAAEDGIPDLQVEEAR
ncbi:MAG: MarR family winged helix-turn-helix transcriptional regulator, partial [Planctomycetota bacterium]